MTARLLIASAALACWVSLAVAAPAHALRYEHPESEPPSATVLGGPAAAGVAPRSGGWLWPVAPPHPVIRPFQPPAVTWGAGHRGVDLGAPVGADVLAPADGTVSFANELAGRRVLVVRHDGGLRSTFEPVTAVVAIGDQVWAGQPVGRLDPTAGHCTPEACLHWGVLRGEEYLDPLRMIGGRVVLLPLR